MPSRLSSLLVRDGLVGVKRMEKAFQRQVIYGGTIDTILLEMGLVPEDRLIQYLALASGLPPAARDEGEELERAATALISRDLAEQYRAVPVAIDGDAVRVLVCAPLEITALEDLADLLDRALQPLIVPEYRWNLVFATAYGLDAPARFSTLARSLDADPGGPAVGRAQSVIVDERVHRPPAGTPVSAAAIDPAVDPVLDAALDPGLDPPPPAAAPPSPLSARLPAVAPDADTLKLPQQPGPGTGRSRRSTILGLAPSRDSLVTPISSGIPRLARDITARATPSGLFPAQQAAQISTESRDSALPIVRARELLAAADDRDTVFLTLLRAARSRARWAGLLTVQGGAAIGRVALAEPGLDTVAVTTVLIPLDIVSPFRTVVSNQQPHIGPLLSGDAAIDAMVLRLGGTMPPSALILPVVLRDRTVAIVVAHRAHSDIRLADVAELLPMATATSDALGRLIVKHKTASRTPSAGHAVVSAIEIDAELVDTKRITRRESPIVEPPAEDPAASSAPPERAASPAIEVTPAAEPAVQIDDVLSEIENADEGDAEDALAATLERAPEAVAALDRRFPGVLRVERFAATGRPMRAAQYGGLLELAVHLGSAATELLIRKLSDPQHDTRFYAAVCAAELRPRSAVFALGERMFDQDYGVRECALAALAGYPPEELGTALQRARRGILATDPETVSAAAAAIVELGDVGAIPDLIAAVERTDRSGEHGRRALVALTAQDFGPSERKWRKWWDGARNRHRVEWLIEGLSHKSELIRETAIRALRRLTGEYFGYHHDLPRKERESAAQRWAAWWRDAGQRRFAIRSTGQQPVQRE